MAEASKTMQMAVPAEKLWAAISDYENYANFVDGVNSVKVLSREDGKARVEYKVELMGKDIFYVLDHVENKPSEMNWTMVESNIMKANRGGWKIKDLGAGKSEATYSLDLEFNISIPSFMLGGLVKSTLPKMMQSFEKRAKEL